MSVRAVHPSISRTPIALDASDVPTACVLCSHNCGLRVDVVGGQIKAVRADEANPITHGYVCNKGYTIGRYVTHGQRVLHPLRRRPGGGFERVSWDEAVAEIARRLGELRRRHGPRSIALVGVGGQANHMDAAYAMGFLHGLGSRRWFNAYAQEKTQNQLVDGWLFGASPAVMLHADTARCRYLLVLGTNPRVSHRGHAATETLRAIVSDPSRRLVVVDPRETETTRGAAAHLRVRPGGDAYLLLAMASHIAQRGLWAQGFVQAHARDADVVLRLLRGLDPRALALRAGLDPDAVAAEAERFARADGAAIFWDLGIEQGRFSTLNAYLIRLLAVLTANVGRPGGMFFFEGINPPGSGRERGEPERALASGIGAVRALGNYGMFSPTLFPEEVLAEHPERIRAVIVEGANPLLSFSDTPRWREAFARLDLKVVIEPAMTETAREADFVLPCPVGYEKWEISTFPTGFADVRAQLRPPVVPAPGEALPEPEIYARLAEAMDLFGPPPAALLALARAWRSAAGGAAFTAAALALARLAAARARNGVQNRALFWTYRALGPELPAPSLAVIWLLCHANAFARREAVARALGGEARGSSPFALGRALYERLLAHPEGTTVAALGEASHLERHLGHRDRRIHLAPASMMAEIARALAASDETSERFPLVLSAGLRTHWTANTIHRDPAWRKGQGAACPLSLSPEDAASLGVADRGRVRISTRRGSAEIDARVDPRMPPGLVSLPNGFGVAAGSPDDPAPPRDGLNANELTSHDERDPFTGCPQHKHTPCRVERV